MGGAAYPGGSMSGARGGGVGGVGGFMVQEGRWWQAFGTGGFDGEPGLIEGESGSAGVWSWVRGDGRGELEDVFRPGFAGPVSAGRRGRGGVKDIADTIELGINPSHILQKSLTVLNPLSRVDERIMDDADLAGPFVFCFAFAFVLLLVSSTP